jgi:hypothetical protein
MVIDLDTEEGRILMGLASIGAMVVGVDGHEEQANTEVPLAVLAFRARFRYENVVVALKRVVDYLLKLN